MKSLADDLLMVAEGVLADYLLAYPADAVDVSRDGKRLSLLVKERGHSVFTLDLPELDETLLQGLESGRLILGKALSKRASPSILVPRLFRGLWLRIFDVSGNLSENPDESAIFFLRQLCCIGKKVEIECSPNRLKQSVKEYFDVERELRAPTLRWESDELGSESEMGRCSFVATHSPDHSDQLSLWDNTQLGEDFSLNQTLLRRLQRNADFFASALGKYDPYQYSTDMFNSANGTGLKHGPGAVADSTQKGYKYVFPNWPHKLERRFSFHSYGNCEAREFDRAFVPEELSNYLQYSQTSDSPFCDRSEGEEYIPCNPHMDEPNTALVPGLRMELRGGFHSDGANSLFTDGKRPLHHEPAARLMAVPKTAKGPRLIAAEPAAHQWCQQLTLRFLSDRLKGLFAENFICFEKQHLSHGLVTSASLNKRLATVDLSSASDRLSCWVVERIFRRNPSILYALHSHRTRWLVTDKSITRNREYLLLKKFASQGTAVTFPVQTIVFFLCAITASGFLANSEADFICNNRICNSIGRLRNKVRIYGDDIIIPTDGYDSLTRLLHLLGLKVNESKSFSKGFFRESCGMDSYRGVDVTPMKPKRVSATGPQSRQSIIDSANQAFLKGLWQTSDRLFSTLPVWVRKNLPVGRPDCGAVCRFSFSGESFIGLKTRFNYKLQRREIRTYGLKSISRRTPVNLPQALIQYYTENPSPEINWTSGISLRTKTSDGLSWEYPFWTRS